jgi:alpha-2-macroglobulin
MIRKALAAALVTAVFATLNACSGGSTPPETKSRIAPPDPTWVTTISQHSSGAISRFSPVRVFFTNDVIPDSKINGDASANIRITPAVKTKATFASRREIVLRPETEFAPGQDYKIEVLATGLTGVPADTKPFEFLVTTIGVNFDVRTDGLNVEYDRNELMTLSGHVQTADSENREKVEKIVSATLNGKPVQVVWTSNDRYFGFAVPNILRVKQEQELILSWDGTSLGLPTNKGSQTWRIPALDEFAVTKAEALEQNDQRQIRVQFSDSIDARQDLKGLISLTKGEFTTSVSRNVLTLYVNQDLTGEVTLNLNESIKSRSGQALIGDREFKLEFANTKPQVRFVGRGVILPDAEKLTVPFEAVSAKAVQVVALEVFEKNIPQFLQVNNLSGTNELGRVGRVLWRKTIPLASPVPGRWTRYELDVTDLMKTHPGGLFQLSLQLAPKDALYECPGGASEVSSVDDNSQDLTNQEDGDSYLPSNWDYYDGDGEYGDVNWNERTDPCKPAYYRWGQNIRDQRNLLASNIGLIAKRAAKGKLLAVATALDSAKPLSGVKVDAVNFQNQVVATGNTNGDGMIELDVKGQPFALIAEQNGRKGYLRVANGVALPVSHFDVGGETVVNGLKGYIYGDRGVWRPGDPIYLTFALQDRNKTLPPEHPVTLEFRNPRGQLVQTLTNSKPVGQFYAFELKTEADAPTGNWNATVLVGGTTFGKQVKVETVMPNRLKIELDLGEKPVVESSPLKGTVSSQWLSGATASGLRANIEVRLTPATTAFTRYTDYVFDDPARTFSNDPITVFDDTLDTEGKATIDKNLDLPKDAPGMLNATFVTRVFERGGAFSINMEKKTVAAFDHYVGVKLPKGDAARDMLLTDAKHTIEFASVDTEGKPVSIPRLQVSLYKVQWRWWWDSAGESLAQYAQSEATGLLQKQTISTKDGRGQFQFEIKYPEWGRYLVRACDLDGQHCTGRVFYVDWPSWAGAQRDQSGPAANVLTLTSDKQEYKVGETAVVQLPEAAQGRALLTLETGSAILEQRWLEMAGGKAGANRVQIPITSGMAPGVYVSVTLVQPHAGKTNDRPIRLYGVVPLKITDPQTKLAPVVTTADEWAPQSKATFTVGETAGRAMDYTVAVVDEGLLGLTSFKTPNLHAEFYKREALGVSTWDLFDEVAGAYGGQLDRLLALGGSDAGGPNNPDEGKSRFPPVVKFLGPFKLKPGERQSHTVDLPQYVGAVRVMVVAGDGSAYGSADKSVFVRSALMILPTLPRVIGPGEQFSLPVSVFTSEASIKDVKLEVQVDPKFAPVGAPSTTLAFTRPEEKLGFLTLKSGSALGKGKIRVIATSGKYKAVSDTWLEVRTPNVPVTRFQRYNLTPNESWKYTLPTFGLAGTQIGTLEVSALPPVNLDGRLDYLVHYPHGCLEQTTSSVFPQLYLPALVKMDQNRRLEIENNIRMGLARLRSLQHPSGGFAYWPGVWNTDPNWDWRSNWGTTYAGHFFLEAEKAGYKLPGDMKAAWLRYQTSAAQGWSPNDKDVPPEYAYSRKTWQEASRYAQAYRLYTLALAGAPELGAMNRLREQNLAIGERWMLASAYQLAGKKDVAKALADNGGQLQAFVFTDANPFTFGSLLRDRAVVLMGTTLLGRDSQTGPLLDDISAELSSGEWYSTQSVAFALVAVAQNTGTKPFKGFSYDWTAGAPKLQSVKAEAALVTTSLPTPPASGLPLTVKNTSDRKLFVTAAMRATPASGEEDSSSNGLSIEISYSDAEGKAVDVRKISQGADLIAQITVKNTGKRTLDNIALSQLVPAGWEIRNDRLEDVATEGERTKDPSAYQRYWWVPAAYRNAIRTAEYTDIRDDRVLRYFGLQGGESIFFETRINAAYQGRFYLPGVGAEAMYEATQHARQKGQWVEVVPVGK